MKSTTANPGSPAAALILVAASVTTAILVWHSFQATGDSESDFRLSEKEASRLSSAELLQLRQSAVVCREILRRADLPSEVLRNSLLFLAMDQRTPNLQLLLQITRSLDNDATDAELRNLTRLFASLSVSTTGYRVDLAELCSHNSNATRQVAYAASVLADDSLETVWSLADVRERREILSALPLVASKPLQEKLYDDVRRLFVDSETPDELRTAGIEATARLSGRHQEKVTDLVDSIRQGRNVESALAAINRIPSDDWPEDQLGFMAAGLVSWLADLPPKQRSSIRTTLAAELTKRIAERLDDSRRLRFTNRMAELLATKPSAEATPQQ